MFSTGIYSGGLAYLPAAPISRADETRTAGPAALWSSWIITAICMSITAASLAEICSSIPLSGSICTPPSYLPRTLADRPTDLWAAAAAGKKYGRFFGVLVAWWVVCAWTSFVASTAQATVNFMMSELIVFETFFPDGVEYTNIKFRAVVWISSEVCLLFAILSNCLSRAFLPPCDCGN